MFEKPEERLRKAMLESDLPELDQLLVERLRLVTLEGANVGKAADLALHRSGALRLSTLTPCDQQIEFCGTETALVNVTGKCLALLTESRSQVGFVTHE